MNKSAYLKKLEQDMIYLLVLCMAIMVDAFIVPDYFRSTIWKIDGAFLFMQGSVFMLEMLNNMNNRNNADIQEEIDVMNDFHNSIFEAGHGKFLFDIKSNLIRLFTMIIIIRLVLHILGFRNI